MSGTPSRVHVVLVVDDDTRVARINAAYVAKVPGFRVTAQAHSAAEALEFLATHRSTSSSWTTTCPTRTAWTWCGACANSATAPT